MSDLYGKIQKRVPGIANGLLEQFRVSALATAPDYAKFMFDGPGWQLKLKDQELRSRFEAQAWNMAFCEILDVLMESDVELEGRISALEKVKLNP